MSDIVTLARRHKHVAPTHYEGCEVDHIGCLVNRLADEIEGLRAQLEERYILMRVRQLEHALDAERQTVRRQRADNERLRENVDRLGKEVERADRLRAEIARVKADNRSLVKRALESKP